MKRVVALAILLVAHTIDAFIPSMCKPLAKSELRPLNTKSAPLHPHTSFGMSADEENLVAAASLSKSETILNEFHESKLTFRIVVIGNGAILETTSKLGPKKATSVSPKTGDKLMTLASEDSSFEFHVKVDQVCMVTFVSTEKPDGAGGTKVMRVSRFLNEKGTPICSLILADSSDNAISWFDGMVDKYGQEAIM